MNCEVYSNLTLLNDTDRPVYVRVGTLATIEAALEKVVGGIYGDNSCNENGDVTAEEVILESALTNDTSQQSDGSTGGLGRASSTDCSTPIRRSMAALSLSAESLGEVDDNVDGTGAEETFEKQRLQHTSSRSTTGIESRHGVMARFLFDLDDGDDALRLAEFTRLEPKERHVIRTTLSRRFNALVLSEDPESEMLVQLVMRCLTSGPMIGSTNEYSIADWLSKKVCGWEQLLVHS